VRRIADASGIQGFLGFARNDELSREANISETDTTL
jgi:hypothetical protein